MISRNTISVLVLGNCVSCECFGGGDIFSGIQAFAQDIGIRDVQFSVDLDPGKRVEHVLDSLHAYCNGEMPVPPEVAREALAPSLAVKTYDLVVLDAWTHAMRSAAFLQGGWLDTRGGVEGMRIPHLTLYAPHIHEVFLVAAGPSEPSLFRDCCSALAERSGNGFGSRVLILNATSHVPRKTKPHPPYRNCNLRYCQTAGVCTESELETYLRGYNQALEGLSSSRLAVLDLDRLFLEKGISKKNCVVHLSREGYGLLAREVLSLLSETFFPELGPQPESV
ncbi:MAG: hypothetical protein JXL84_18295, partial [Deltaproteobacteria bacterium]|nr:hypothetical protein [Deltaproteobacteria bacterium]